MSGYWWLLIGTVVGGLIGFLGATVLWTASADAPVYQDEWEWLP